MNARWKFLSWVPAAVAVVTLPLAGAAELPARYITQYPQAERFVPPIRSTFYEVSRTMMRVRGRRFRQKRNGGYGLPVADKIDGRNLLHVGADLGWYQVGEPVRAVAAGIVRMSVGPDPKQRGAPLPRPGDAAAAIALPWGNLVVVEHRVAKDEFVTTLYGHLDTKRLVRAGDVVEAGQVLGTIGRQAPQINGGYRPHLHFGVHSGRLATAGRRLIPLGVGGKVGFIRLAAVDGERIEVTVPAALNGLNRMTYNGVDYPLTREAGRVYMPAKILWSIQSPDFPLVGYALETDGWLDPVAFLRARRADRPR